MLVFEIPKENRTMIEEIKNVFPNCNEIDVNSLDAETMTNVIVPVIEAALPVVSAIIVAALGSSKKVKVKWDGIEISGTEKQVEKFLDKIVEKTSPKRKKGK